MPLHIEIQKEALKAAKRLTYADSCKHHRIWENFTRVEIHPYLRNVLEMHCDKTQTSLVTHRNFKTSIPTREEWKRGLATEGNNRQIWYTDGSKMTNGTGAGVHTKNCDISISLGKHATVFQAEVYAIIECAQEIINRKTTHTEIYILSDSQAAIKALNAFKVSSKIVMNCIRNLNRVGRNNKVRLVWVPGHEGIQGNEKADELARKGSEANMIGPEPYIGISEATIKLAINEHAKERQLREWRSMTGLAHSKAFIKNVAKSMSIKLLNLSKDRIKKITAVFTGHYGTNYILNKIGIKDDQICRHCQEEAETMKHLLCECNALGTKRMDLLGNGYPKPEDYGLLPLGRVAKLVGLAVPPDE